MTYDEAERLMMVEDALQDLPKLEKAVRKKHDRKRGDGLCVFIGIGNRCDAGMDYDAHLDIDVETMRELLPTLRDILERRNKEFEAR